MPKQLILLVEDDDDFRELTSDILLSEFDVEIVQSPDGYDAIEKVRAGLIADVVISDYLMPKMNGFELADALFELNYENPVIFVTGVNRSELIKNAFGKGSYDFVTKPLDSSFTDVVGNALSLARMGWSSKK